MLANATAIGNILWIDQFDLMNLTTPSFDNEDKETIWTTLAP